MNCANHPEVPASAFCRECGKPMCSVCERPALGSVYCQQHVPVTAGPEIPHPGAYAGSPYSGAPEADRTPPRAQSPVTPPYTLPAPPGASPYTDHVVATAPDPGVHPVLALILGFFPGVGAIYNGQYAKGLVHAVIFGLLVSIESNARHSGFEALFGIMIGAWVFYQVFEAYHTARQRRYGVQVEEFSSLFDIRPAHGKVPVGAIALIGLGFILLLDTTDIISMEQFERYWPGLLIVFGLYMLYARLTPDERGERHFNGGAPR